MVISSVGPFIHLSHRIVESLFYHCLIRGCTSNAKYRPAICPVKVVAGPGGIQVNGIHAQHMAAVEGCVSGAETLSLLDGGFSHTTNTHPEIITAFLGTRANADFKIFEFHFIQNSSSLHSMVPVCFTIRYVSRTVQAHTLIRQLVSLANQYSSWIRAAIINLPRGIFPFTAMNTGFISARMEWLHGFTPPVKQFFEDSSFYLLSGRA